LYVTTPTNVNKMEMKAKILFQAIIPWVVLTGGWIIGRDKSIKYNNITMIT